MSFKMKMIQMGQFSPGKALKLSGVLNRHARKGMPMPGNTWRIWFGIAENFKR
jgi:hypothetical protein